MEEVYNTGAATADTATSQRKQRVLKHLQRNKEAQQRSAHRRNWDRAERQRAQYLASKYGNLSNAFKVIDFLKRPTKTKLKKFQAQAAAVTAAAEARRLLEEEAMEAARDEEIRNLNIVDAVAEKWNTRKRSPIPVQPSSGPSSVSDSGCSADGIITPQDAHGLQLDNLGQSDKLIRDAGGRLTPAANNTLLRINESTGKAGKAIVAPIQRSLEGVGKYSNRGYVVVYHPHYEGVTVHEKDDIIIDWQRPPVCTGWRDRTDKLWHWSLKAPMTKQLTHWLERDAPTVTPLDITTRMPKSTVALANNVYKHLKR